MIASMVQYGSTLTGREYGKTVASKFFSNLKSSPVLDFEGVISMGSSFGDEVFKILEKQGFVKVHVKNTNKVIQQCLKDIASDLSIEIVLI